MNPEMLEVDDATKLEFHLLKERVYGLGKHVRWLAPLGAFLVGGSILAFGGQALIGLDPNPTQIDIPANLLLKFSDSSGGGGESGVAGAFSSVTDIAYIFSAWVPAAAIAVAGAFGIIAFLKDQMDKVMRCFMGAALIGGASIMVPTIIGGSGGSDSAHVEKSDRLQFVQAASEDRNLAWTELLLKKAQQEQTPQGLYVLAQVQLSKEQSWAKPVVEVSPELVATITAPSAGFTPSAESLYAIENAAYGEAKSAAAIAQVEAVQERKGKITTLGSILGVLGIIAGAGAVFVGALRRKLNARADRIERMLRGLS
ncbi:hypothetical protein ACN99C_26865 (plasmid) [Pseudomonas alloputida]|uniref:hypothetical protein n=1 Tax=Pseudomonas alloputida TaxID=1940621 RepID=UPI003B42FBE2